MTWDRLPAAFIPLVAAVVYLLVRGIETTAARVTRIALALFVVFYGAFEVLVGIGTGIPVDDVNGLAASDRAAGAALVNQYNDNVLIRSFGVFPRIGSAKPGGGPSIRSAGTAALGVARLQDSPAVTALHGKGP